MNNDNSYSGLGATSSPSGQGKHGGTKIFLIGIMGSGKTHWAQRLADQLNMDWIDLDQQIEKATDMPVHDIFATEGEEYFRLKERDTLRQFAGIENIIISTGGGTPCFHNNMEWMNDNGITIWLNVNSATLAERLKRKKYKRPLISHLNDEEMQDFIQAKIKEREPYYAQAKHHISGSQITIEDFTKILTYAQ
ncbi:shikimate kinase [Ilyomonas limi]|uniref:Shikimate kinase n=1 Tax=Ilyomonas limi TaxID=2575867 RepID=A0A4U3KYK7_9BACT|nr:shikimate kinase [Ilyomonas limi]TKK67745.1 shikimate kinase [Ilyomonas limi]